MTGIRTVSLVLLTILALPSPLAAQAIQPAVTGTQRLSWVDRLLEQPERDGIAGSVCAVVKGDEILHLQGYGVQDRATGVPIDPGTTRFYLASVTKVFTATLVWRLIDRGLLDLDEDVSVYLQGQPELSLLPSSSPVTLGHLLTHTAGFDDRNIGMAAQSADQVQSLDEYLATMPPQVRPAGQITMYDNHGWALAGLICERVTGQSYPDLLQQEIFAPLNMSGCGVNDVVFQSSNDDLAQAYVTRYENGRIVWKKIQPAFRHTLPAGGICATGTDLVKFMQMQLNRGVNGDESFLSETATSAMQTQAWSSRKGVEGLTPGFWETQISGQRLLLIVGSAPEGASLIALAPDSQLGVFLAASRRDGSYLVDKLQQILEGLVRETPPGEMQTAAISSAGWPERERKIAGEYYILRFSQNSMESLAKWQVWFRVSVLAPGKIRVVDSQDATHDYVEVSDWVFRNAEQAGYISFKSSPDGADLWATTTDGFGFSRGLGFANSFQKARWYERIGVKRPVLLAGLLVFLAGILIWPLVLLIRQFVLWIAKPDKPKAVRGPILPRVVIWGVAVCGLTGALGIAALLADADQLLFGLPVWGSIPIALLWIFAMLTPVGLWLSARSWVRKWWSIWERITASLIVLIAAIWIPFLWNWSLIGF